MARSRSLLSVRAYARSHDVNESTIRKAVRAGKITLTADGLVDPVQADAGWYRYSAANPETRPADDFLLDDDYIRRMLTADGSPGADDWLDEKLRGLQVERPSDDRILEAIAELTRKVEALTREVRTDRPYIPGLAELKRDIGSVEFKLGVVFHQLVRAIEGKPINISADAFPPETRQAGNL